MAIKGVNLWYQTLLIPEYARKLCFITVFKDFYSINFPTIPVRPNSTNPAPIYTIGSIAPLLVFIFIIN